MALSCLSLSSVGLFIAVLHKVSLANFASSFAVGFFSICVHGGIGFLLWYVCRQIEIWLDDNDAYSEGRTTMICCIVAGIFMVPITVFWFIINLVNKASADKPFGLDFSWPLRKLAKLLRKFARKVAKLTEKKLTEAEMRDELKGD